MMTSRYSLKASAGTHPGQLREINQDHVMAFVRSSKLGDAMGLLIVADGMGGHQAGEIASQLAVDTIHESLVWMLEEDDSESSGLRGVPVLGSAGHDGRRPHEG